MQNLIDIYIKMIEGHDYDGLSCYVVRENVKLPAYQKLYFMSSVPFYTQLRYHPRPFI